jgi:hypothetical protein
MEITKYEVKVIIPSSGHTLTQAKEVYKNYNNNKYLLNSIKLKRIGVNYDKINGKIL